MVFGGVVAPCGLRADLPSAGGGPLIDLPLAPLDLFPGTWSPLKNSAKMSPDLPTSHPLVTSRIRRGKIAGCIARG